MADENDISVDDALGGAPGQDVDLALDSPSLKTNAKTFQDHMDFLNGQIADLTRGSETAESPGPYAGALPTDRPVYIDQHGNLTTSASAPPTDYLVGPKGSEHLLKGIDARAPLSQADIKSRNDNDQFFASHHGAITENDVNWVGQKNGIFANSGPTAQNIAAGGVVTLPTEPSQRAAWKRDTRWAQFPNNPVGNRVQSLISNGGRVGQPSFSLSPQITSGASISSARGPLQLTNFASPAQPGAYPTPPINAATPAPFSRVSLNLRPDRIYPQQPNQ